MLDMIYDTIIIGAGIAGSTAAIYAARERMKFLLITREFGGQFMESGDILNYPGIIHTNGAEFAMQMEKQLEFNGVTVREGEEVKEIKRDGAGFQVVSDKAQHETRTVIIATGARPRKLRVPGEDKYAKKGVHYCAICDGPLFAGKDVAIIGGGNSALGAVDFMKNIAKKIYLVNIDEKFNAQKYLVDRIKVVKNVEIITSAKTTEIFGDDIVQGLRYEKNGKTKPD
jgi:thioredoxin reductase